MVCELLCNVAWYGVVCVCCCACVLYVCVVAVFAYSVCDAVSYVF